MLSVMEKFYSIQGEGSRAGIPSVFIRFAKCNFRCPGFKVKYTTPEGDERFGCDSFYSVDPKFKNNWKRQDWKEIVKDVNKLITFNDIPEKVDIVITGGEPLLNWKNEDFQSLIAYYISRGHKVTIETNASLDIEFNRQYQKEIMFSMSVKLNVSGELYENRVNIENLINILENSKDSYFKFVVSKKEINETIIEIDDILKQIPYYAKVYLMPLGDTQEELNKNAPSVIEKCIEKQFYYSDRLHIRIWDNKKGV